MKAVTDDRMAAMFDLELAKYRDNGSGLMNELITDKNISKALLMNRIDINLFASESFVNKFTMKTQVKDFKEAAKISGFEVQIDGKKTKVPSKDNKFVAGAKKFGKAAASVIGRGAISYTLDDQLMYKTVTSPDKSFKPVDMTVKKAMATDIRRSLKEDESSLIPKVYKRMLLNTSAASDVYAKWAGMLQDYDFGYAPLPDDVAKTFKEKSIDKWKDEAFYTYPDLELMSYSDVAPSGSIRGMLPSYRDLGIPLYGVKETTEKARTENDLVEPDFYFFNLKIKDLSTRNISFDSAVKERGDLHDAEGARIKENVDKYQKEEVVSLAKDKAEFDKNQATSEGANVDRTGGGNVPDPIDGVSDTKFAKDFGNKNGNTIEDTVVGIVDGDTVDLKKTGRVRLKGIDTPEGPKYDKDGKITKEAEPGYAEAKEFLEEILPVGTVITVNVDAVDSSTNYKDIYGRALVYLDLKDKDVNHEILKKDLAVVDLRCASSRTGTYLDTPGVRTNAPNPNMTERGFGGAEGQTAEYTSMLNVSADGAIKKSKDPDAKFDGINIYDQDHLKNMRSYFEQSISDDMFRMVRAFPTYKLYFVEEDNEAENLWDDLYAYNAIESIEVHKSKDNASDSAVITVSNMSGNLDHDLLPRPKEALRVVGGEVRKYQDEIESMRLKSGRRIMIKMGYSTNVNELTTVFTGKVTSVQYGDMVTFEAQGYGVELLQPKGYDYKKSYLNSYSAVPYNILLNMLKSPEVQHFGKRGFGNLLEGGSAYGNTIVRDEKDLSIWARYKFAPQEQNIYINRTNRFLNLIKVNTEFRTYKTTIWEVFQEMARRCPGNITAVVPYDKRATIFYGLPNQPYLWTGGVEIPLIKKAMDMWRENKKLYDYKKLASNDNNVLRTEGRGQLSRGFGRTGNQTVNVDKNSIAIWIKVKKGSGLTKDEAVKIEYSLKNDFNSSVIGRNVIDLAIIVIHSEPERFNKIFGVSVSSLLGRVSLELADPKNNNLFVDQRGNIVTENFKDLYSLLLL